MNRIILIGNGFDLAHGMKISYGDFINDYWGEKRKEILSDKHRGKRYEDDSIVIDRVPPLIYSEATIGESEYKSLLTSLKYNNGKLRFKNEFLETLTQKRYSLNWVDIENEYYTLLKNTYKTSYPQRYRITDLNRDFKIVELLLEKYLNKIQSIFSKSFPIMVDEMNFKKSINQVIYSDFNLRDFSESSINHLTEEIFQNIYSNIKDLEEGNIHVHDLNLSDRETRLYSALGGLKEKKEK